jgi:hypothetical protein
MRAGAITGCEPYTRPTRIPCMGCSSDTNRILLMSKYIRVGSRACDQFAILTGCGCLDGNEIGYVRPLVIVNPPGESVTCETPKGARFVKTILGC